MLSLWVIKKFSLFLLEIQCGFLLLFLLRYSVLPALLMIGVLLLIGVRFSFGQFSQGQFSRGRAPDKKKQKRVYASKTLLTYTLSVKVY